MSAGFVIFGRKNSRGKTIFYARFKDSEGNVVRTVSTKLSNRTDATVFAQSLLKKGIVASGRNPDALRYFLEFWSPESEYVQLREAEGHKLSANHISQSALVIRKHFAPFLNGRPLMDLDQAWFRQACLVLKKSGISHRTINKGIVAIKTAYKDFCQKHNIQSAIDGFRKFSYQAKNKGILTVDEVRALVRVRETPRVKAAILLATFCGLRMGECRGLQFDDVDFERGTINVIHNIVSDESEIKQPKWGSKRIVAAPSQVLDAIRECRSRAGSSPFVLFQEDRADYNGSLSLDKAVRSTVSCPKGEKDGKI